MSKRNTSHWRRRVIVRQRSAFTLIELLITISIISLLMSLALPGIHSSRESARRIQCANRVRNLGIAILGYETAHKRFPAAGYWGGPNKTSPWPNHNWVVEILPYVDRQELFDRWDKSKSVLHSPNLKLSQTHLKVLVCPSDITANSGGDLSYSVNGGVGESTILNGVHDCIVNSEFQPLDLNGNGITCDPVNSDGSPSDRELFGRLGLFFTENFGFEATPGFQGTVRHHSVDSIVDGASNTLLLTENVRVGYDPHSASATWASPHTRRSRVFFSHRICPGNVCSTVNYSLANSGDHAINAGLTQAEGEAPWPSSFHAGGVNAVFADGHVTFLDENIDGRVYAAMFSPQGTRLIGTSLDQGVVETP